MNQVRKELLRKSRSLMSRAARSVEEANLVLARAKEIHSHLAAGGLSSKCLRPVDTSDHSALRDNSANVNLLLELDIEAESSVGSVAPPAQSVPWTGGDK